MWKVNEQFESWAKSHSGCDGGGMGANGTWFCGIEYGGEYAYLADEVKKDYSHPSHFSLEDLKKSFKYQFDRKVAKLFTAIAGKDVGKYEEHCIENRLFSKESSTMKLNLYPIACRNESESLWTEGHYKITGLPTKALYKAWCQENRFSLLFRQLVEDYAPKIIICTGITYEKEFLLAFAGTEKLFEMPEVLKLGNTGKLEMHKYIAGKTNIFVTPFLGPYKGSLNSDSLLQECGIKIRNSCI